MIRWRLAVLAVGALLAGLPLAALVADIVREVDASTIWSERGRLMELAANSLALTTGVLSVALPLGVAGAVLLFRTNLPGRSFWRLLAVLTLFVPLTLVASAWQMAYSWATGHQLWLNGLAPAIVIHATLALPWVIVLVGLGLTWVEPELEEDALLAASPWRVVVFVTLPRALPAIGLAAIAAILLTLNEIAVTDRLQVRTFAEEVYSQFVAGRNQAAIALPQTLATVLLTWLALSHWRQVVPPRQSLLQGPRLFSLGTSRWPLAALCAVIAGVLFGLPLAGLVWKAGLHYGDAAHPGPPVWDAAALGQRLALTLERQMPILLRTMWVAALTGALTGFVALILCWLARGSRWFERVLWLTAAIYWALPGPVVGIGLLQTIEWLLDFPGGNWLEPFVYSRPSPWPHVWVCGLRFFPLAVAALWPLLRLLPAELDEMALLDGLTAWQRVSRLTLPLLAAPLLWAALGVAILTLGEVSATKLLETPDFKLLAKHVFELMHSSADTEVAAVCLLWLFLVSVGGVLLWLAHPWLRRWVARW